MKYRALLLSCFGGLVACSLANSPTDPENSTSTSSSSSSSGSACTGGDNNKQCGDDCVDLMTNPEHCGACNMACAQGETCNEGKCEGPSCASPEVSCLGECVDLMTNTSHCGGCEQPCAADEVCVNGACSVDCPGGWEVCGDVCVDTQADINHCGGCDKPCGEGEECASGVCQCPQGTEACANTCVDTSTDLAHCGKCDNLCPGGANATTTCAMGTCGQECNKDYDDCNMMPDGCETNLTSDLKHCGKCGNPCPSVTNGTPECKASACGIGSCNSGYDNCDNQLATGCETNLNTDDKNCGQCKYDCGVGNYCSGGKCKTITGCDWNQSLFPIAWGGNNVVGDLTFDSNCNLYLSTDEDSVFRVDYNTKTTTKIATMSSNARGIAFNPNTGLLYVAVVDTIYSMTTSGANIQSLVSVGSYLNGMTVAPAGWGSYGGYLIVARSNGDVVAVNPTNPSAKAIGTATGVVSDVEFGGQVLYVAANGQQKVLKMTSGGVFSDFSNMQCSVDGLAVHEGVRVFASCNSPDSLYSIPISNGTAALITNNISLDGGWAPSGLIWDGKDNLIVMTEVPVQLSVFSP